MKTPQAPRPDYKANMKNAIYHFGKTGITKRLMMRSHNEWGTLMLSIVKIHDN